MQLNFLKYDAKKKLKLPTMPLPRDHHYLYLGAFLLVFFLSYVPGYVWLMYVYVYVVCMCV